MSDDFAVAAPRRLTVAIDVEVAAYAGLAALALLLRLIGLGEKPLHHDESIHAWFAWRQLEGDAYEYDPAYHGPVQIDLTTLMYLLFGVGDAVARVAAAVSGTALVILPYFLRRQLGRVPALVAAGLFCLTPSFLYFSRFSREDIHFAFVTLALIVVVFAFLEEPKRWHPALIGGLLAVSFATKETAFISAFVAGMFFLALLARQLRSARADGVQLREAPLVARVHHVGVDAWVWGAVAFAVVFMLLFTVFLSHAEGLVSGLVDGLDYWLGQHSVRRGDQPWFFYGVLLVGYEWPLLVFGAVGVWWALRRPSVLRVFLVWMFVGSTLVYSWAGERMPWLVLHVLLPLVLLAGVGADALWRHPSRRVRVAGVIAAAAGAVFLVHAATALSYRNAADPKELAVFTQTSVDVPRVVDQIRAIDRRMLAATGRRLDLDIDAWGGGTWPWVWYRRDLPTSFPDMSDPGYRVDSKALIVTEPNHDRLRAQLRAYTGYRFRLREWWVPEYGDASIGDWARWVMWRTPWSPTGSFDEWLYVRNDIVRYYGGPF